MHTISSDWPSITRVRSSRHSKKVSCETLSLSNVDCCSSLPCEQQNFYYYSDDEKDNRKEGSAIGGDEDCELEDPIYGYGKLDIPSGGYLPHDRELENHRHGHGKLDNPDYGVNIKYGYFQQDRELENPIHGPGKLENPGYSDGKAFPAAGSRFLACLLPKMSHSKPDVSDGSRVQAGERWKKRPQAYTGTVYRTGGLLPHSGRIILHIGSSHSGPINNINNKAPTFLKASSIIPPAIGKMNLLGAGEPFSPKVTCLGGVRIKQKCRERMGKSTSDVANGNIEKQVDIRCTTSMLKRREKATDTEDAKAAFAHQKKREGRVGLCNIVEVDCCIERSEENVCGKASRCVMEEESKRWSLRENTRQDNEFKASYQHEQKWQSSEASACGASSSEAEFSINLSRFGPEQGYRMILANTVTNLVSDTSQRFELKSDGEFAAPAPPRNALLLMRNTRSMEVTTSSQQEVDETFVVQAPPRNALLLMRNSRSMEVTTSSQQEVDETFVVQAPPLNALLLMRNSRPKEVSPSSQQKSDKKLITQAPPRNALLLMRNSRAKDSSSSAQQSGQETSCLPTASSEKTMSRQVHHKCDKCLPACLETEMEMKEWMDKTDTPSLMNLKMDEPCSMALKRDESQKNVLLKGNVPHRLASFPQASLELSLWQRRAIAKPCALDILKPIKSESKQATTTAS